LVQKDPSRVPQRKQPREGSKSDFSAESRNSQKSGGEENPEALFKGKSAKDKTARKDQSAFLEGTV